MNRHASPGVVTSPNTGQPVDDGAVLNVKGHGISKALAGTENGRDGDIKMSK